MFSFFAKRIAVNTGGVVASAAIANGSYAVGAAAYDYGSNKFEAIMDNFRRPQSLSQQEREEEYVRVACSPFSY